MWQPSDIISADTAPDVDAPRRRGRIPQSAWPQILERHRAGDTLSAIARQFDCTPSAISYIVRKAEAAGIEPAAASDGEPATAAAESAPPPVAARSPLPAAPVLAPSPVNASPANNVTPFDAKATRTMDSVAVRSAHSSTRLTLTPVPSAPPPVEPVSAPITVAPPPPAAVGDTAARSGRPEPAPPVDATEARLRETARGCLSAYRSWRQAPGEGSIQALNEAVHDLRKTLARIEIDISASRRDEQAQRPIPIPAHRAARPQRPS